MLTDLISHVADAVLAAPVSPAPTPPATTPDPSIDTSPVLTFLAQWVAPILIAGIGILVMSRAKSGRISEVMTTVAIALMGIAIFGGAAMLPFVGDDLVRLFIQ